MNTPMGEPKQEEESPCSRPKRGGLRASQEEPAYRYDRVEGREPEEAGGKSDAGDIPAEEQKPAPGVTMWR